MSNTPPIFPTTPGAGSADPDVVTLLARNDKIFLEQYIFYNAVANFLNVFKSWKENSQQRVANGLPPDPPPIPPAGYTPTPDPPAPVPPPPDFTPIIGTAATFPGRPTFYPALADANPPGTIIANPYKHGFKLIRVSQDTPFGVAQYWEELPS